MRYEVKVEKNDQNRRSIHLDKRVSDGYEGYGSSTFRSFTSKEHQAEPPSFVKDLMTIDGIMGITLHHYEVDIEKGEVFDWDDLVPQAISVLRKHLDAPPPSKIDILIQNLKKALIRILLIVLRRSCQMLAAKLQSAAYSIKCISKRIPV